MSQYPSRALGSSLKSLHKLHSQLEAEFREVAAESLVDIVSCRFFDGRERPTMALIGKAMDSFQTLYAVLCSAILRNQPNDSEHLSKEAIQESSFEFAYADSGAAGFVFTMPNDRLSFGETSLDAVMSDLFAFGRASTAEDVKSFAKQFGHTPVQSIYNWANALCASSSGADVQGKRNESTKGLVLQSAQVEALRDLIAVTSDLEINETVLEGILLGFDSKSRAFRFEPSSGSMIRGKFANEADIPATVTIPKRYSAKIRTLSRIRYSTEQHELTHELLTLS